MDDKQVAGSGSPQCSNGAMGCLLPVSLLLVFGAAMVVAAAAFFLQRANLPFIAIAIGLLALVVFFAFGIAVLIFLFVRGGGFGGRCCRRCCCECSCSCGCSHSEKAKA